MEAPLLEPDQTEQSLQTVEPEPQVCTDICSSTLLQHSLPLPGVADVLVWHVHLQQSVLQHSPPGLVLLFSRLLEDPDKAFTT